MRTDRLITVVGCHAEGEVGRVITGGVLSPPGKTLFDQKRYLETEADDLRRLLLFEPRGGMFVHAHLIVPPTQPGVDAGFIIMEPTDYPPMSGSNSMCVVTFDTIHRHDGRDEELHMVVDPHKPLRDDIRLLGDLLGEILRHHAGQNCFDTVEAVRALSKSVREGSGTDFMHLVQLLESLPTAHALCARGLHYFHGSVCFGCPGCRTVTKRGEGVSLSAAGPVV